MLSFSNGELLRKQGAPRTGFGGAVRGAPQPAAQGGPVLAVPAATGAMTLAPRGAAVAERGGRCYRTCGGGTAVTSRSFPSPGPGQGRLTHRRRRGRHGTDGYW